MRLKQICNFDPASGASCKAERLEADLEEVAASGQKAIVFSQWVDTLKKLGQRLARFHPLQYHGQIPSGKRDQVLAQFRRSQRHRVLLMSYGAGGVGLNLQYCGYVFLYDRWWNPAVEDQAVNRAHRIGAAGPVTITRMLTNGTIEERIDQILREKRAMFDEVLGGSLGPAQSGPESARDLRVIQYQTVAPQSRLKAPGGQGPGGQGGRGPGGRGGEAREGEAPGRREAREGERRGPGGRGSRRAASFTRCSGSAGASPSR